MPYADTTAVSPSVTYYQRLHGLSDFHEHLQSSYRFGTDIYTKRLKNTNRERYHIYNETQNINYNQYKWVVNFKTKKKKLLRNLI